MFDVEVWKFHKLGKETPIKKRMLFNEYLKLSKQQHYYYRAYQIGFNTTIINIKNN
jgi:hypothetical protein